MIVGQKVRLLTMDELIAKGCYLTLNGNLRCYKFLYESFFIHEDNFEYCGKIGTIVELDHYTNEVVVKFGDGKRICSLSIEALDECTLTMGTFVQLKAFDELENDENYYLDVDGDLVSKESGIMLMEYEFKCCGKVGKVIDFDDDTYVVDFDGFVVDCINRDALIVVDAVELNAKINELVETNQKLTEQITKLNTQLNKYEVLSACENNANIIENLEQGQYLSIDDDYVVIVAQVDGDRYDLISLKNGNRWYNPKSMIDLKSKLSTDYVKNFEGTLKRLSNEEVIAFLK